MADHELVVTAALHTANLADGTPAVYLPHLHIGCTCGVELHCLFGGVLTEFAEHAHADHLEQVRAEAAVVAEAEQLLKDGA